MLFSSPLPQIDHDRIVAAIQSAEQRTSGEIRVAIARRPTEDPLSDARKHFERLEMHRTAARNGVLIFVAPRSRNFAVIGDTGVHEKCGDGFWTGLADAMTRQFQAGDFEAAIILGVERTGELLAAHFPPSGSDQNELPDDVDDV